MRHPMLGFNQIHHLEQNIKGDRGSGLWILRNLGCAMDISVKVNKDYYQTATSEYKWPAKNVSISLD